MFVNARCMVDRHSKLVADKLVFGWLVILMDVKCGPVKWTPSFGWASEPQTHKTSYE